MFFKCRSKRSVATGSWWVNMATGRPVRRLATAITEQEAMIARMAGSREDKDKEEEIGRS